MSESSPAVVAHDVLRGRTHVWCVAQRKGDAPLDAVEAAPDVRVTRVHVPADRAAARWARLDWLITALCDWLAAQAAAAGVAAPTLWIEGYAHGMDPRLSSSISKLHELGGALRRELWRRGWTWTLLYPTYVKKGWTGSGKAQKRDMVARLPAAARAGLLAALQVMPHQNPIQDVADAWAVGHVGHTQGAPTPKVKRPRSATAATRAAKKPKRTGTGTGT